MRMLMKKIIAVGMITAVLIIAIISMRPALTHAGNYGSSTENDSTVITYTHHISADSAHCAFRFGGVNLETDAYDSVFLYPVDGGVDGIHFIADALLDLDSIGFHNVMITVFDGGAIIDTTYGGWMHDANNQNISVEVSDLVGFFGACDGCYQRMFPFDGSSNKDSMWVIDQSLGVDSVIGRLIWGHSNVPSIYDTAKFYNTGP